MVQATAKSKTDDDPFEQTFISYWSAYLLHRHEPNFRYEPFLNFIYYPETADRAEALFNYLHEFAHAQLNGGVLGLALFHLQKLPSIVEKQLFEILRPCMNCLLSNGQLAERLYKELFLFGEPRGVKLSAIPGDLRCRVHESFRQVSNSGGFGLLRSVFETLNARRCALFRNWREVQEGYATFEGLYMATDLSGWGADMRKRAIDRLFGELTAEEQKTLTLAVSALGRAREVDFRTTSFPRSSYTRGYHSFDRILREYRHPAAVHIAALAASHFPYDCCRLLDMSDDEFSTWIGSTRLNPNLRLKWICDHPGSLSGVLSSLTQTGAVAPSPMEDFLEELISAEKLEAVRSGPTTFGLWLEGELWRSKLFSSVTAMTDMSFIAHDGTHLLHQFTEDRSKDFRHGEIFDPPIIFENGVVAGQNRVATMRNFVDFYEVQRTTRLLRFFDSLPLGVQ